MEPAPFSLVALEMSRRVSSVKVQIWVLVEGRTLLASVCKVEAGRSVGHCAVDALRTAIGKERKVGDRPGSERRAGRRKKER